MFDFNNKKEPPLCGGTDRSFDKNAPRTILSEDMTLFKVTSELPSAMNIDRQNGETIDYISVFAAPASEGTFIFLETESRYFKNGNKRSLAYVKENVFPSLAALTREQDLAANNGSYSFTHGLPKNFGGAIDIRYASGEKISISSNQSPVISGQTGEKIAALFTKAINGEKVYLPDVENLKEIRFVEERKNGGFTRAALSINDDGSGSMTRSRRFSDPKIYNNEKSFSADEITAIKKNISDCGIFAWSTLPECSYPFDDEKSLTFIFKDGSEITVPKDRELPDQIKGGFFNIELELTK